MRKILLQLVHPAFERSRANRALVDAVRDVDGITVRDMYEAYPDFLIDVAREQELLLAHDVIVFQHPLFWYSSPALLKEWQDLVLEYGFAYGAGGRALEGKAWMSSITAGGAREAYCAEGSNRFSIRALLRPFEQTARLCHMRFLAPFVTFGANQTMSPSDYGDVAHRFRLQLESIRDAGQELDDLAKLELVDARRTEGSNASGGRQS